MWTGCGEVGEIWVRQDIRIKLDTSVMSVLWLIWNERNLKNTEQVLFA